MDQNWDFWTKTEGYRLSEWEGGETSRWFTEWVRESVSAAGLRAAISALRKADVTALLPKVRAPSLVLHRTGLEAITVEMAKEMASTIPGARLLLLDGPSIVPYLGTKGDEIAEMIRTFVAAPANEALEATRSSSPLTPRETEILRLIAAGRTSSEISRELSLSVRTVGRHITNIYGKIEANSRAEATAYALNHGIA
jgi:DNA-binding CsgD family transcriptional regulator